MYMTIKTISFLNNFILMANTKMAIYSVICCFIKSLVACTSLSMGHWSIVLIIMIIMKSLFQKGDIFSNTLPPTSN